MNLCGVTEAVVETPVAARARQQKPAMSSSSRPPPLSPLKLPIVPPPPPRPPSLSVSYDLDQQQSQVLLQTPRCSIRTSTGTITNYSIEGGATPSPALLNPLAHEFWSTDESATFNHDHRFRGDAPPPVCPRLDPVHPPLSVASSSNTLNPSHGACQEPLVKRLQSGFRVKLNGRVVEIRLSEHMDLLHIIDDDFITPTKEERYDQEEKSLAENEVPAHSNVVHEIDILDIEEILEDGSNSRDQKRFSILLSMADAQLDFECVGVKQQEAIVTALRSVLSSVSSFHNGRSASGCPPHSSSGTCQARRLRMRPRNATLPAFRAHCSSTKFHPVTASEHDRDASSFDEATAVLMSPMQRTCIYPAWSSSGEAMTGQQQGTELALYNHRGAVATGAFATPIALSPRPTTNRHPPSAARCVATSMAAASAFTFSEVSEKQSLDELQQQQQQQAKNSLGSSFAASLREALDEWCSQDACIDLTEVAESLEGMFLLFGTQNNNHKQAGEHHHSTNMYASASHAGQQQGRPRADSCADLQTAATLCVKDFFETPAAIWAELPSPNVSYYSYGGESSTSANAENDSSMRSHRKILNRASVGNAQAFRWNKLQSEMTLEPIHKRDTSWMHSIETTKSLDDLDGTDERVASSPRITSGKFTDTSGYGLFELFPSGFWEDENDPTAGENEDCYYYDSDPECARIQTRRRSKGPRRARAEQFNVAASVPTTKQHTQRLNFSIPRYVGGHQFDDEYVTAIIEIMKSELLPLMWHPTPTEANSTRAPLCVSAWIESGTYLLNQAFVQPKFMWRHAKEMNLEARRLNIASESPERVDLLEITRVQDAPTIDRQKYPFARQRRCFMVETRKECHLFEAQSVGDKKRIVFGLKLTISRLASLIMVRDIRAVEEFFEPAQVPGEAPAWAT